MSFQLLLCYVYTLRKIRAYFEIRAYFTHVFELEMIHSNTDVFIYKTDRFLKYVRIARDLFKPKYVRKKRTFFKIRSDLRNV